MDRPKTDIIVNVPLHTFEEDKDLKEYIMRV